MSGYAVMDRVVIFSSATKNFSKKKKASQLKLFAKLKNISSVNDKQIIYSANHKSVDPPLYFSYVSHT